METINLTPYAPTLVESTRSLGYSLGSAVADIIDNSISAGADHIQIFYNSYAPASISILDNGRGMDKETLNNAMRYGSKNPSETRDSLDLGRFGMGLKTASLSQCRSLTVISKQGRKIQGRRWDLDYIAKKQDWALQVLNRSEMKQVPNFDIFSHQPKGTLVVWEKLDRMKEGEPDFENRMGHLMDEMRSHLSLVFHRYLAGEEGLPKLKITMNGYDLTPVDPFLKKKSTKIMEDEVLNIRGEKVIIRPFLLPAVSKLTRKDLESLGGKDSLARNQGFYVYRNKRLIIWGTWFRMAKMGSSSQLARIQVDVPNTLDSLWSLDIKKSTAVPPAEISKNLENLAKRMTEKSHNTWAFRGKKEMSSQKDPIWEHMKTREGNHYFEISRKHPFIQDLQKELGGSSEKLNLVLRLIEQSLPYNQIFVDMNNQGPANRESAEELKQVEEMLRKVLAAEDTPSGRAAYLSIAASAPPFSNHPDIIQKLKEEFS